VVGVLTLIPVEQVPGAPGSDKLHHLVAFGAIAMTGVLALPRHLESRWIWVMIAVALYGGAIELIQPHVGRFGEWGDWVADTVGAILGGVGARLLIRLTRPPNP
jgi:VanZ family protein